MKVVKRLSLMILIVTLSIVPLETPVMAAKLPNAIWALFVEEAELAKGQDMEGLMAVELKIIALLDDWQDTNTQKLDIVTPRYQKLALYYEEHLMYDEAVTMLEAYVYYAGLQQRYGGWNDDAYLWGQSKLASLDVAIDVYAKTETISNGFYTGAKYEPLAGTYFGAVYDKDERIISRVGYGTYDWAQVRHYFPKKNSAYLVYLEFGTDIQQFDAYFQEAKDAGVGVQLAWNVYETFDDMSAYKNYIEATGDYLNELDLPVFLRYGSEMNVAEHMSDAREYVTNYRFLADTIRKKADNVALVWSVNDVTASDRQLSDYYPGDTYVDWVGISTYTYYYFGDRTDWGDQQAAIDSRYFTGPYANPINKVKEVIDFVDGRKPIMIAESGVAHYSKVAEEDMTVWAVAQLRRQYAYMPLVYPEVKGIFYFNTDDGITKKNSYALYTNETMAKAYNDLIEDDLYIKEIDGHAAYRYGLVGSQKDKSIRGQVLDLKTYSTLPGETQAEVVYQLAGKTLKATTTLPYELTINASEVTRGHHVLKVLLKKTDGTLIKSKDYTITKDDEGLLIEEGLFEEITFGDLDGHWSASHVQAIAKRGIIVGSDGVFRPNDFISRAEMTSIISKLGHLSEDQAVIYSDVPSGAWYKPYISGAQAYLIGFGQTYEPKREATREEIIAALMKLKGYRIDDITESQESTFDRQFSDADLIDPNYKDYLILAVREGIASGYADDTLKPSSPMKRGEVAKVIEGIFY